jgi:DNA-binding transcriptional regulator YdaS (Cro superfamily)
MNNNFTPIETAIEYLDGQSNLAKLLQVSPSVVHHWLKRIRPVPAIYCLAIEKATGVSRRDLRPKDWQKLWPELAAIKS